MKTKTHKSARYLSGIFAFIFLFIFLMSSVLALIPQHVSAAGGITFIDKVTLTYSGKNYTDVNPYDGTHQYVAGAVDSNNNTSKPDCHDTIDISNFDSRPTAKYTAKTKGTQGTCSKAGAVTVSVDSSQNKNINAYRIDANTIYLPIGGKEPGCSTDNRSDGVDSHDDVYKRQPQAVSGRPNPDFRSNTYGEYSGGSYNNYVYVETIGKPALKVLNNSNLCGGDYAYDLTIANRPPDAAIYGKESTKGGTGSGTTNGSDSAAQDTCESNSSGLGWIMCPVINLLDGVFNWLDTQIQALLEVNQDMYKDPAVKNAWGNIRNIAYFVLVPIMLVMVIGTALNFGFLDAYTVKKALPRMVAAIIFIALSWTIVTFIISFFNVLGTGVLGLMTQPFGVGGNATLGNLFKPSAGGAVASWAGIGGTIAAFFIPGVAGIALSYVGAGVLALGIAWLVLVARQLFILLLALMAPLAILAWIFPGNDKLWKQWWGTFSKLLIMFPLITGLIATGRIFAYLIGNTPSGGLQGGVINPILKITAYIIPYAFIPFTFKFAGGAFGNLAGMVNDRGKGMFDRLRKGRQTSYHKAGGNILQKRANATGWLDKNANMDSKNRFTRGLYRTAARGIGVGNVEAAMSSRTAEEAKVINDQIATGRDDSIRGLTVNMDAIRKMGDDAAIHQDLMRINDGKRQYKSLGGAWIDESAVLEGQQRWGKNQFAQQAALSYEMRKANTSEEVEGISERYSSLATDQWGQSERQAGGSWIGAAFENQNQHLEYKYTDWQTGNVNGAKMASEIYEKRGSYPLAQMHAKTIDSLKLAYDEAKSSGDIETQKKIQGIAETFVYRGGAGGQSVGGDDPEAIAQAQVRAEEISRRTGTTVTAADLVQTNTPGAAHTGEEVRRLAVATGVYQGDLGSPRTRSDGTGPTAPNTGGPIAPPDIPRGK